MVGEKIKFVKRVGVFLLVVILLLFVINEIYEEHVLTKKNFYRKEIQYQEFLSNLSSRNIETLFFGDSHVFHGVNPEFINNSFNWGSGTQNYIKTYYLLERIVNEDKVKVENVVLQIDSHSFSGWLTSEPFLFNELELYSDFVSLRDVKKIRKEDSLINLWLEANLPVIGKGKEFGVLFFGIDLSEMNLGWIKNYNNFSELTEEEKKTRVEVQYKEHFEGYDRISNISLEYFKEILELTEENNINLILVKYPVAKEYNEILIEKGLNEEHYYKIIFDETDLILDNYSILDHHDLFFNDSEYLGDPTHVNYAGAEILSKRIYADLNELELVGEEVLVEEESKIERIDKKIGLIFLLLVLTFLEGILLIMLFGLLGRRKSKYP